MQNPIRRMYRRSDLFTPDAAKALDKLDNTELAKRSRALWGTQGHLYGGTVPRHVKEKRRAANRRARKARRANRG